MQKSMTKKEVPRGTSLAKLITVYKLITTITI